MCVCVCACVCVCVCVCVCHTMQVKGLSNVFIYVCVCSVQFIIQHVAPSVISRGSCLSIIHLLLARTSTSSISGLLVPPMVTLIGFCSNVPLLLIVLCTRREICANCVNDVTTNHGTCLSKDCKYEVGMGYIWEKKSEFVTRGPLGAIETGQTIK